MSRLLFADPGGEFYFGTTDANIVIAGVWGEFPSNYSIVSTAPVGRNKASDGNSYAIFVTGTGTPYAKYLSSSFGHLIAGTAVFLSGVGFGANIQVISFTNGTANTTTQCDVRVADTSGHLEVTNNGTQRGSTSTQVLTAGWHYIELDVTFATGATGTADVWVDGVRWIHATSVITATTTATANRVYLIPPITFLDTYWKDIYIIDGSVSPNTPLGDSTVSTTFSNGAGVNSAWTPNVGPFTLTSVNTTGVYQGTITGGAANAYVGFNFVVTGFTNGGNNITAKCTASTATALTLSAITVTETHSGSAAFQCIVQDGINHSGVRPDGDVTYISDSNANDISDFSHEALTLTGTIYGVIHVSSVRKDDAGSRSFRQVCLSGATTETNGADISATNTYLYYYDCMDVDPNTSSAWTVSNFNAATMGVKEIT